MIDAATMERLVPDLVPEHDSTGAEALKLHLERYQFAASHISGGMILDIACGVGYGSRYLMDNTAALSVTGVDLSSDAVAYAKARYAGTGVMFRKADAMTFQDGPFDVAVSLETIEHLPDPSGFVRHVVQDLLRAGGIFIGSVPITPSVDANPHHLTDFTAVSFRRLLTEHGLEEVDALTQVQPFNPIAVAKRTEIRMQGMRPNLLSYYIRNPDKALLRLKSTLQHGFTNKYLTLCCRKR